MFKLRQTLFGAALVSGFALVATASIFAKVGGQKQELAAAAAAQIDIAELTSNARNLPQSTYPAF